MVLARLESLSGQHSIAIKRWAEVNASSSFAVYEVIVDETNLPAGVTLIKRG